MPSTVAVTGSGTREIAAMGLGCSGSKDFLQRRQLSDALRNWTSLQCSHLSTSRVASAVGVTSRGVGTAVSVDSAAFETVAPRGAIMVAILCVADGGQSGSPIDHVR